MNDTYPPLRLVTVELRDLQIMSAMNVPASELSTLFDSAIGIVTLTDGKIKYGNVKLLPCERVDLSMRVEFDSASCEYQLRHIRYFVVIDNEKTKNWPTIGHTMNTIDFYDLLLKYNSTKPPKY